MALATTCPRCKTSFRVVPDQLKLRRGFVRCGRCRNVFAGIDHLRYVDDGQLHADADVEYVIVGTPPHDPPGHEPVTAEELRTDEAAHVDDAYTDTTPAWLERYESTTAANPLPAGSDADAGLSPAGSVENETEGESAIDYFSTRRSRGFADRRGIAAAFVALALVVALVLQFIVAGRATIAAQAPALAPILAAVLAPFGLGVGAPSELDELTIESFELQASEVPDVLEMRALLRNHADHPVRWPSMQLTLTDRSDRVLVRRTLDPDDYLRDAGTTPDDGLPAQTEWPLHLALEARDLHLAGYDYRVRLFYP